MLISEKITREITGYVGSTCCHKTGGINTEKGCECRSLARAIIIAMTIPDESMIEAGEKENGSLHYKYIAMMKQAFKES